MDFIHRKDKRGIEDFKLSPSFCITQKELRIHSIKADTINKRWNVTAKAILNAVICFKEQLLTGKRGGVDRVQNSFFSDSIKAYGGNTRNCPTAKDDSPQGILVVAVFTKEGDGNH